MKISRRVYCNNCPKTERLRDLERWRLLRNGRRLIASGSESETTILQDNPRCTGTLMVARRKLVVLLYFVAMMEPTLEDIVPSLIFSHQKSPIQVRA
jgi:hypothetical protein